MMAGMGTLIGRTTMDHTAIVVFTLIIMTAGFRRRLLHLHRGLLSLRDSKKADDDWVECGARTHSDSFAHGGHSEALLSECEKTSWYSASDPFLRSTFCPSVGWCSDTFDAIIDRV
jgi:hypothetical protein